MNTKNIQVVGAGVSGMTTALLLLKAGFRVTLISKEPDGTFPNTSLNAHASWWPVMDAEDARLEKWADDSLTWFESLAAANDTGVTLKKVISLKRSFEEPWFAAKLPNFRHAQKDEINAEYADAHVLDSAPLIDPSTYLVWLRDQVLSLGGVFKQQVLNSLEDVSTEYDLVINCTGLGAKELAKDDLVFPAKAQVLRIKANGNHGIDYAVFDDSGPTCIVPHADYIKIGYVLTEDDWSLDVSEAATKAILERVARLVPGGFSVEDSEIIGVTCALRPERKGWKIRVENDTLLDGRQLIHNYGHDGMGYITSYGIASAIAEFVTTGSGI